MRDLYISYNDALKNYHVQAGHDENRRKIFRTEEQLMDYFKTDSEMKKILVRGRIRFIIDVHNPIDRMNLEEKIKSMKIRKSMIEYYSGENEEKLKKYRQSHSF